MANDLRAFARALRQASVAVEKAGNAAASRTADQTNAYAKRLSSGPFSSATLAILDHPFATRHGSVQMGLDPSVINKQTGLFKSSWRVYVVVAPDGMRVPVVRNVAPYATYLETGTRTMFARPMKPRLEFFAERTWARIAPPLFESALRLAFQR